jgi:hypothetical protein
MSYQRVGTPKAYLDVIQPLLEKGIITGTDQITGTGLLTTASSIIQLFDNKPNNTITIGGNGTSTQQTIVIDTNIDTDDDLLGQTMFVAILGHNLKSADAKFRIQTDDASDFGSPQTPTMTNVCNSAVTSAYSIPTTDGWSLATYVEEGDNRYQRLVIDSTTGNYNTDIKIGCILLGVVYQFPNAPDLNITKTFNYDGVSINESLGGQKYAHATYLTNGSWVSTNPWGTSTEPFLKSGRVKLDMSFSYLSDTNVFTENLYNPANSGNGNQIVPKLLYLTNGGMFPFLLQLDKDENDIDDGFLWCRLDNEPSFSQVAYNQYSTQLSFVEEF